MNLQKLYEHLNAHAYTRLFVEDLGWSHPASKAVLQLTVSGASYEAKPVAELGGVMVLQIASPSIPDPHTRMALHRAAVKLHREHLLIFTDTAGTQSLWYWVKREDGKLAPRSHLYVRGQPADLFLSKLQAMQFELAELDEEKGKAPVTAVAQRLKSALDVEVVTKKFFKEFQQQHLAFLELIEGIPDERDRRWYASVLLNRLMFVWFLQKKGFVDNGDYEYLDTKFAQSQARGKDRFYSEFLAALFFEGFAKPEANRSAETNQLLGKLRYLNGGLFLPHRVEQKHDRIRIPDAAFANLFQLFKDYSWNLDDRHGGKADEINPDVLGYIFEKYINQKAFGAYYTRPEITRYLCEQTLHALILERLSQPAVPELNLPARSFATLEELLLNLDAKLCHELLALLPTLSVLDPACGSGAFLVAAMKTLVNIYGAVMGRISVLNDPALNAWKKKTEGEHRNLAYHVHKTIITDNLHGVDIMEEAAEIARLRLFLALVACARTVEEIEPLPNIDFNILSGNSLIGLLQVDGKEFDRSSLEGGQPDMFRKSYSEIVAAKNRAIDTYRHASSFADDLRGLRDGIEQQHTENRAVLGQVLGKRFADAGVRFEEAIWDAKTSAEGKAKKRPIRETDVAALKPFHWGYEFDPIINRAGGGGFDVILANPPWEAFKPNGKEFFEQHSDLVSKKKMTIHEFEKEQATLLKDPETRRAWESYLSSFPHVNSYFRTATQYKHQLSIVNGKRASSDLNLYRLFTEQCFNLLRNGGYCGLILDGAIYNSLGSKGLRELLFEHTELQSLFGLSNEKWIFEAVHHAQRICIATFRKGRKTEAFSTAFRINPREAVHPDNLENFLHDSNQHLSLTVDLVRRLSPDSLSVMEFKNAADVVIAEKMLRFTLLGEHQEGSWTLSLCRELHMTDDSRLFKKEPNLGRLPLYEGKMIHQFNHDWLAPKYWVEECAAREELMAKRIKRSRLAFEQAGIEPSAVGIRLDYESFRLAFRDVASNTNERTLIATVLPPRVICPHTMSLEAVFEDVWKGAQLLRNQQSMTSTVRVFVAAIFNSFAMDYLIRQSVTNHLSFFYIYNLPVPRLTTTDPRFAPIVTRATRLICTTPAFDALRDSVAAELAAPPAASRPDAALYPLSRSPKTVKPDLSPATEFADRARLRAELDGLVAHLYGLTEAEFVHILGTFPLVPEPQIVAAHNAFRDVANGVIG